MEYNSGVNVETDILHFKTPRNRDRSRTPELTTRYNALPEEERSPKPLLGGYLENGASRNKSKYNSPITKNNTENNYEGSGTKSVTHDIDIATQETKNLMKFLNENEQEDTNQLDKRISVDDSPIYNYHTQLNEKATQKVKMRPRSNSFNSTKERIPFVFNKEFKNEYNTVLNHSENFALDNPHLGGKMRMGTALRGEKTSTVTESSQKDIIKSGFIGGYQSSIGPIYGITKVTEESETDTNPGSELFNQIIVPSVRGSHRTAISSHSTAKVPQLLTKR